MNFLTKHKRAELEAQEIMRNRIILYKQVFGSKDGREVLIDLMNEVGMIEEHDGTPRAEGRRGLVTFIMKMAGMNLAEFDRLWRGEEEQSA